MSLHALDEQSKLNETWSEFETNFDEQEQYDVQLYVQLVYELYKRKCPIPLKCSLYGDVESHA